MAQRLSVVMTLLLCQPAAAPPALALALVPSAAAASCAAAAARRALASICSCFISHQKMAACSICPAELQATSSEPHSLAVGQKPSAAMRRQVASTPSKSREYECTCARGVGGGGGERGDMGYVCMCEGVGVGPGLGLRFARRTCFWGGAKAAEMRPRAALPVWEGESVAVFVCMHGFFQPCRAQPSMSAGAGPLPNVCLAWACTPTCRRRRAVSGAVPLHPLCHPGLRQQHGADVRHNIG